MTDNLPTCHNGHTANIRAIDDPDRVTMRGNTITRDVVSHGAVSVKHHDAPDRRYHCGDCNEDFTLDQTGSHPMPAQRR